MLDGVELHDHGNLAPELGKTRSAQVVRACRDSATSFRYLKRTTEPWQRLRMSGLQSGARSGFLWAAMDGSGQKWAEVAAARAGIEDKSGSR